MNRWTSLGAGTALFGINLFVVTVNKLPTDFPAQFTIQQYQDTYAKPTMVGTPTFYAGMQGIHPFQIVEPSQLNERRPTFVSSRSLRFPTSHLSP